MHCKKCFSYNCQINLSKIEQSYSLANICSSNPIHL